MKTILLPDGVADAWWLICAGGEVYESRVCKGSEILAHLAELCFGSKDAEHECLDRYADDLADDMTWHWCGDRIIGTTLACGEDPDIEVRLIDDPAALGKLNGPAQERRAGDPKQ